jgi:hypothetical protein
MSRRSEGENDPQERDDSELDTTDDAQNGKAKDIMRGRDFAGTNIAATEREQTRDRERVVRGAVPDEAGEFVTDAEVEAREIRRAERHED